MDRRSSQYMQIDNQTRRNDSLDHSYINQKDLITREDNNTEENLKNDSLAEDPNASFQNILKLLSQQRQKIDNILSKTQNIAKMKNHFNTPHALLEEQFIEDLSGFHNNTCYSVDQLRQKIEELKKQHRTELTKINDDMKRTNNNFPQKALNSNTVGMRRIDQRYMSPAQKRNINQSFDLGPPSQNSLNSKYQDLAYQFTQDLDKNSPRYQEILKGLEGDVSGNSKSTLERKNKPEFVAGNEKIKGGDSVQNQYYLPPVKRYASNERASTKRSNLDQKSMSKFDENPSINARVSPRRGPLLEKDYFSENESQFISGRNNSNRARLNSDAYFENKHEDQNSTIKKIYLKHLTQQTAIEDQLKQNFIRNIVSSAYNGPENSGAPPGGNASPNDQKSTSALNEKLEAINAEESQFSINKFPHQKSKQPNPLNQQQQQPEKAKVPDQDIFSMHRQKESLASLNEQSQDFSKEHTIQNQPLSKILASESSAMPASLASIKYYEDFDDLVKTQALETIMILEQVFENSKNKPKNQLLQKLSDFQHNFTQHAEQQDQQIKDLQQKYHHFKQFNLTDDIVFCQ